MGDSPSGSGILDQDQEVAVSGDLMDKQVGMGLGMAVIEVDEELELAILEVALVVKEEEDTVVEDLYLATRVGAIEVVMTAMEEEIIEVEITMTLEIVTWNLLTVVQ